MIKMIQRENNNKKNSLENLKDIFIAQCCHMFSISNLKSVSQSSFFFLLNFFILTNEAANKEKGN